jgi:hypothetical protein
MLSVVIREGRAATANIADTFEALQEAVGGYVEPFFTEPSPEGNGAITGYVNEDGLCIGLPVSFGVIHSPEYITPLAGNAVIVGLTDDGETRGLTETEAARVLKCYRTPPMGLCPVVTGPVSGAVRLVPVRGVLHLPALALLA